MRTPPSWPAAASVRREARSRRDSRASGTRLRRRAPPVVLLAPRSDRRAALGGGGRGEAAGPGARTGCSRPGSTPAEHGCGPVGAQRPSYPLNSRCRRFKRAAAAASSPAGEPAGAAEHLERAPPLVQVRSGPAARPAALWAMSGAQLGHWHAAVAGQAGAGANLAVGHTRAPPPRPGALRAAPPMLTAPRTHASPHPVQRRQGCAPGGQGARVSRLGGRPASPAVPWCGAGLAADRGVPGRLGGAAELRQPQAAAGRAAARPRLHRRCCRAPPPHPPAVRRPCSGRPARPCTMRHCSMMRAAVLVLALCSGEWGGVLVCARGAAGNPRAAASAEALASLADHPPSAFAFSAGFAWAQSVIPGGDTVVRPGVAAAAATAATVPVAGTAAATAATVPIAGAAAATAAKVPVAGAAAVTVPSVISANTSAIANTTATSNWLANKNCFRCSPGPAGPTGPKGPPGYPGAWGEGEAADAYAAATAQRCTASA